MVVDTSIAPARGVSGVDVVRIGLIAAVVLLLAVAAVFTAHRLAAPADGTEIGVSVGQPGSVSVAVRADHAGSAPIEAGDRIVAILGRDVDAWGGLLLNPGAVRPALGVEDPIALVVSRGGQEVPLTLTAARFDPNGAVIDNWALLLLALAFGASGVYVVVRRGDDPAARVVLLGGAALLASAVGRMLGLQALDLVAATGFWLYATTVGLAYAVFLGGILRFALVFPRPDLYVGDGRRAALAWLVPLVALVAVAVAAGLASGRILAAADAWQSAVTVLQVTIVGAAAILLATGYGRVVDPVSRLQLRWLGGAAVLAAVGAAVLWFGPLLLLGEPLLAWNALPLVFLPIPVALAITIGRRHPFDLDAVLNRSVVYGGLTAGVIVTYALVVALLGRFIPGNAPFAVALLSACAVAVVALPLHDRLQRAVNRLMFGDRDDPDRALRRLGLRLETSLDPHTVLPTLVEAVADALRSPYVAIEVERDGEAPAAQPKVEAAAGQRPIDATGARDLVRLPIVYRGRPVGHLALCRRGPGEAFSAADERLLADLARQAAPAVEAVRLTADLRRSREALVTAREEERRRLRRDLHDELGPALAGSMMKVAAARSLLASDPARAAALLDDLAIDSRGMIDEIRRIAYNLRPPALDEVGLIGALRQHVAAFDDGGSTGRAMRVYLDAPDTLPPLPAAVEVAALRIALEGLTNAARHSGGSSVQVRLAVRDDAVEVVVADDGIGLASGSPAGVGLTSMRERAEELGGRLRVKTSERGGTTVVAHLPLGGGGAS